MIQFNLLPDVKLEYIKMQRLKRIAVLSSTVVIAACAAVLLIGASIVYGVQKKSIRDLDKDISSSEGQIKSIPDLNKILTIQNQLNTLPSLNQKKPVATRLFGYISQLTPNQASISDLNVDFTKDTISLTGQADTIDTIDKFADTLKFTKYTAGSSASKAAFSSVVLSNYTIVGDGGTGLSYELQASFDPLIFDASNNVQLTVPTIISTRSETDKPNVLFVQPPAPPKSTSTTNNTKQ